MVKCFLKILLVFLIRPITGTGANVNKYTEASTNFEEKSGTGTTFNQIKHSEA